MLISRETDYAIRILRALQDNEVHAVPMVCEAEHVPESFGYKIVRKLSKAGLIQTHRGAGGGISLDGYNGTMTLYDLLEAMDDSLVVNACTAEEYECSYRKEYGKCKVHDKLCRLQKKFARELKSITLAQLLSH